MAWAAQRPWSISTSLNEHAVRMRQAGVVRGRLWACWHWRGRSVCIHDGEIDWWAGPHPSLSSQFLWAGLVNPF
jgi:hypothetical protein